MSHIGIQRSSPFAQGDFCLSSLPTTRSRKSTCQPQNPNMETSLTVPSCHLQPQSQFNEHSSGFTSNGKEDYSAMNHESHHQRQTMVELRSFSSPLPQCTPNNPLKGALSPDPDSNTLRPQQRQDGVSDLVLQARPMHGNNTSRPVEMTTPSSVGRLISAHHDSTHSVDRTPDSITSSVTLSDPQSLEE